MDLALNNLQRLTCHKTQQTKPNQTIKFEWGSSNGLMANMLDCNLQVNGFKLLTFCYIHFRTNTLGKAMNLLIPQAMG